ncbi:arylesterase [Tardibacter chloracetimidivorans]|uniref:Arylesterase n=1 Tax=Tardibacter chloracetimidivorans TaxID=1921510 RepID=A0A1L3ZUH0_9SPHN|nr:arylesterase [Tardibacter chloracetimidivorans]API59306.1 arylesterase [Tardibacter chloracetimidivorans]
MKMGQSLVSRTWVYGAPLLLVQLIIGCSPSAPEQNSGRAEANVAVLAETSAVAEDKKLVVAFGDSLFAGYNLDQDQGFAPALERSLSAQGLAVRVLNAGVSGDTSAAGLQRLAFTLDGLDRKPDLVIVGLGANDMLRGLSPRATRANLEAILTELKKRDIPTMLTGMVAAPNMGTDYAAAFNPIYPELAEEFGVPLYPFFLEGVIGNRALLLPDGMHPNDRGVNAIVSRVSPMIAAGLEG